MIYRHILSNDYINEFISLFDHALYIGSEKTIISRNAATSPQIIKLRSLFTSASTNYYTYADLIDTLFQRWMYETLQLIFASAKTTVNNDSTTFEKLSDNFFESFNSAFFNCIRDSILLGLPNKIRSSYESIVQDFVERIKNIVFLVQTCTTFLNYRPAVANVEHRSFEISEKVKTIFSSIRETNEEAFKNYTEKIQKDVESELNSIIKHSSESSITILGIFVGVVMAFWGGFTVLENAIEGLSAASYHRLYFTMLLFGGMLYNIVILLFFLVGRLTGRSIACKCHKFKDNDCSSCKCKVISRTLCSLQNKFPYIFWVDLLILFGMVIIVALYYIKHILPQIEALHISRAILCVLTVLIVLGAGVVFNFCVFLVRIFIVFLINKFKKK